MKDTKRRASGKLWERLQTFKKTIRRSKALSIQHSDSTPTIKTSEIEKINEKLQFLYNYLEPYDKIVEFWNDTVEARAELFKPESNLTIGSYVDKFPILKSAEGYKLYKIDFDHYYKDKSNNLLHKWTEINTKLINIAEKKNKPEIKNLLTFKSNIIGFFLLPYLLSTPVLGKRKLTQTKRSTKLESADSFFIFVSCSSRIQEKLVEVRRLLQVNKQTLQPTVILVGENKADITEAYLAIDDSLYNCEGPIEAIDACFKSYTALNAKFPESAHHIWMLIQKYIYNISTVHDKNYTTVNSLISDLT
ncbi:uncharacterized protein LOC129949003 [Eupeodes corollae]|uniref:uncharacterized protein LOC129949003 n=1 Tax=Eupeodes corollae TaxID=290404 RepID=UPI0024920FDD|nr:uncharacterized protein LOC129949003 [Eupeodes corollae]